MAGRKCSAQRWTMSGGPQRGGRPLTELVRCGDRATRHGPALPQHSTTNLVSSNTVHLVVTIEQAAATDDRASRPALRRSVRSAPWLTPFLLSAGSAALAVLAVVGAEMAARWWAPDYLMERRGLHVFSETLGWAPRKDVSVLIDGKRVTFNARGYRGRELATPKEGGRARVIVLGDSIAFGLNVADQETFTHLLDARDNGIEAGNLAVQGYGPDQELLALVQEGLRYDPDVVVLAFCLTNDFVEAVLPVALYDGRTPKPHFRLVGERLVLDDENLRQSASQRVHQWLGDYSQLFNLASALGSRAEPLPLPHWRTRKHGALQDEDYTLRLSLALVRRMEAVCRERGISFLVAAFPNAFQWQTRPSLTEAFLRTLGSDGITVVDMSAHVRARGLAFEAVALDGLGHLSPLGHLITAEVLEAEIASLARPRVATSGDWPRAGLAGFTDRTALRSPRNGAAAR
jgi:hypothetical protein